MNLYDYVGKRIKNEGISHEDFWDGYEDYKIGIFLKEVRERRRLTQEELANRINTTKSVISRMENHSEDIKLSTIEKVAKALGKKIMITIQ